MFSVVFKVKKSLFVKKHHLLTLLKNTFVFPLHNKIVQNSRWFQTAISERPWWNFTICLCLKYSSLNSEYIVPPYRYHLNVATLYELATILKIPYIYFTLRFSSYQWWWPLQDRFDRYSKTLYCACVLYVIFSRQGVGAPVSKTSISMNLLHSFLGCYIVYPRQFCSDCF